MDDESIKASYSVGNYSPSYWWPEDKDWCICTDYDLDFTIVGCSKRIFDAFLANEYLECIEVSYDTRIDYKAIVDTL